MWRTFKKYPSTISLFIAVILAIFLFSSGLLADLVDMAGRFGYLSAAIAGFLFSITFTAPAAALYFVELGEHLHPAGVIVLGALGAMGADLLMYRFFKRGILAEIKLFLAEVMPPHHREKLERLTQHRVFLWGVPFLASILIASPFPDEIGLALFGLINFKPKYLSILAFIFNGLGILTLVYIGYSLN